MLVINPPKKKLWFTKKNMHIGALLRQNPSNLGSSALAQQFTSEWSLDKTETPGDTWWAGEPYAISLALLVNIDVDGRKTAAGRASANSAVHVVVGYIVIVGSRMGVGNAHCTVVASCGFMWLPHLPGQLSWQGSTDAQDGRQRRKRG